MDLSARQKAKALDSMTEVVQTVKHPKSHSRTVSHETSGNLDYVLPKSIDLDNVTAPGRLTPVNVSQSPTTFPDAAKNSRKSSRISLMGLVWLLHIPAVFASQSLHLHHSRKF